MFRRVMTIVFVMTSTLVFAQSETLPEALRTKIDQFFDQIQQGEVEAAYQKITEGSLVSKKTQQVLNLVNQTNNAISIYGALGAYAPFSVNSIHDSIFKTVYISKNKTFPLRWQFVFYKASEEWTLIAIEFDDDIESLFD